MTGGAGFIGSHLVRALAARGVRVRVLDNLSTGSADNLDGGIAEVRVGDIRDPRALAAAARGIEVLYHLAALPSVARSMAEPLLSHEVNASGTLQVLMSAREQGVRRVVFASSSSVYGDTPTLPKHEGMPASPNSPYGASKLAGEAYCRAFTRAFELETVALRFFNVFGPRQDPSSEYSAVIPRFITRMLAGQRPLVLGDGGQSRDFTYVDNVVEACIKAADSGPKAVGESINVGCGARTSLLELVSMLNDVLGTDAAPEFSDPRPGDVRHSEAGISRAATLIGYRPETDLREGLSRTARWFAERGVKVGGGS